MKGQFDTSEFQCEQMRKMKLDDIDPCIAVCLLCESEADFQDLCNRQDVLVQLGVDPIFNVDDVAPNYDDIMADSMGASGDDDEDGDEWDLL